MTGANGAVNPGVVGVPTEPGVVVPPLGVVASLRLVGVAAGAGVGVGVGVALGLKGFFGEPRTRRRPARSASLASATIGSVVRVDSSDLTAATAGAAGTAGSLESSIGTAAAAAIRRIATGHSLRCTMKRKMSLKTVMGWLQLQRSGWTEQRWRWGPGRRAWSPSPRYPDPPRSRRP